MEWRRVARDGAIVGAVGAVAFFLLHAAIVEPIWRAWWRAPLALVNGAIAAFAYRRLLDAREPTFTHPLGGMALGALAALALGPFLAAGWMRSRGAPDFLWALILTLLLVSFYQVTQAAQERGGRWRRLELPAALVAMNALPAYFLTFISDFHEEMPDPFPFTLAVGIIYVGCGAVLTRLVRGRAGAGASAREPR